jgi:hypothetical protein
MPIDTHRRLRSRDESDQLPYSKASACRAVRTTIGQELKARYELPRDLPHEMATHHRAIWGECPGGSEAAR